MCGMMCRLWSVSAGCAGASVEYSAKRPRCAGAAGLSKSFSCPVAGGAGGCYLAFKVSSAGLARRAETRRRTSASITTCTTYSRREPASNPISASRDSSLRDASTSTNSGSKNAAAASSKATPCLCRFDRDRKSGGEGKSGSGRVDFGGGRIIKKKKQKKKVYK